MSDQQSYGGSERRSETRYLLDDTLQVIDTELGEELGTLLDLHHQGFMVMCPKGAQQGHVYTIKLLLPRHIDGCSDLNLQAQCLWVADSMSEADAFKWAGFSIVPDSVRSLIGIKEVIAEFGVEPKG